jgi:hypothetical protein
MFSALKKLAAGNNKNEANGKTPAGGQQAMHASLQKKFAKGVHYNSKIVNFCFCYDLVLNSDYLQ